MHREEDAQPNVYEIPKGFDSKILIKGVVAFKTLIIWLAIVAIGYQICNITNIEGTLKLVTIVFHMIIGIILLTPRISHPDRPTYEILKFIIFDKDNSTYSSIDYNKYVRKENKDGVD